MERKRGIRRRLEGLVVSDKMDKTVVVEVSRVQRHPLYVKTLHRRKRYKAHDEQNECHAGDRVRLVESRPYSREKRWRVEEILERAR
jgi:small subunit ribosomal protein S17